MGRTDLGVEAESRRDDSPSSAMVRRVAVKEGDRLVSRRAAIGGLLALISEARAVAQTPPGGAKPPSGSTPSAVDALAAAAPPSAPDWPKVIKSGDTTVTFYLPQLDSWDGQLLEVHSAVSVQTSANAQPVFGVATLKADTEVDKSARRVTL